MTYSIGAISLLAGVMLAGTANAAVEVPSRDKEVLDTCLYMSTDAMVNDWACRDLMKRWEVNTADMVMMKACKAMAVDRMSKDADCSMVRSRHPVIVTAAMRP